MPMSDEEFYKSLYGGEGKPPAPLKRAPSDDDPVTQFRQGSLQGLLNMPESLGQLAERGIRMTKPGFTMPFHASARDFRNRVESSGPGIAGEVAFTALPALIPGAGQYMLASRAPLAMRTVLGATQGVLGRPSSGSQNEQFTQAVAGGVMGALGGGQLARYVPPHIGSWMHSLPHNIKIMLANSLLRSTRGIPPGAAGAAAGAVTPRENPQ